MILRPAIRTRIITPVAGSRRATGGFTLIETVAVIVILAIMAAVALPSLSQINSTRAGVAARQLLKDMTFARQRAITTGIRSWVVFDPAAGSWSILAENPASPGRANAALLNDLVTGRPYITTVGTGNFVGVSIVSCNFDGESEVGFDWLGRPLRSNGTFMSAQGSAVLSGGRIIVVEVTSGHIRYVP